MKKIVVTVIALFLCACTACAEDNVLLWMFSDPDIFDFVDGNTYKAADLNGRGEASGKSVNALRISTVDNDGNTVYLNLKDDMNPIVSSYLMMPSECDNVEIWNAGPAYADLAGIDLDDTSRMFMMEIGYAEFDGDNLVKWTIMATGSDELKTLISSGYIAANELSYQGAAYWSPSMAVPEPNSAMLVLLGAAAIMLRRKRKTA